MVAPNEPEFQQAYTELVATLRDSTLFQKRPELERILKVVSIPERVIQFRVPWENDNGEIEVNNGFRVQFNSALGPYKGGLRFHPTVTLSVLKFLGFEQVRPNPLDGPYLRKLTHSASAGLQECADGPQHGRRQGRLRL